MEVEELIDANCDRIFRAKGGQLTERFEYT